MSSLYDEDIVAIARAADVPWDTLADKTVVVTGATGLVGGMVARALVAYGATADKGVRVVLPVRNVEKARSQLGDASAVELVPWDAMTGDVPNVSTCDFIVHCASNTDSRRMVEYPVDTVLATVEGTRAMLELARATGARMCFVSSMEVYGAGSQDPLTEACGGALDAMNVRSSYPQAKQLAETLCASYAKQYGVDVCVARLAQSFGPGIVATDRRVFAEFARCCRERRDIHLLTDGSKSNMYVYTADAVRALLLLSVCGEAGEAYNVANPATFCSIWEMAHMVAREFGTSTQVSRVVDEAAAGRYAVSGRIWMDTSKLRALGWQPTADLPTMYARMMADWDESASAQPERQTPSDEPAAQTAQPDRPEQPTPPVRSAVQSDQPEVTTRA